MHQADPHRDTGDHRYSVGRHRDDPRVGDGSISTNEETDDRSSEPFDETSPERPTDADVEERGRLQDRKGQIVHRRQLQTYALQRKEVDVDLVIRAILTIAEGWSAPPSPYPNEPQPPLDEAG
jgi:hypothetical protein